MNKQNQNFCRSCFVKSHERTHAEKSIDDIDMEFKRLRRFMYKMDSITRREIDMLLKEAFYLGEQKKEKVTVAT